MWVEGLRNGEGTKHAEEKTTLSLSAERKSLFNLLQEARKFLQDGDVEKHRDSLDYCTKQTGDESTTVTG